MLTKEQASQKRKRLLFHGLIRLWLQNSVLRTSNSWSHGRLISSHEITQTLSMFSRLCPQRSTKWIANAHDVLLMPYRLRRFILSLKYFLSHRRFWNLIKLQLTAGKQKSCSPKRTAHCIISDYARVTLPERRQRVQTFTRFTSPSTIARTVCTLGFQAALVWRLEWLTLLPDMMPLPQTSQICAIVVRPPSQNQAYSYSLKFNMSILPQVELKSKHFSKMSKKNVEIVL